MPRSNGWCTLVPVPAAARWLFGRGMFVRRGLGVFAGSVVGGLAASIDRGATVTGARFGLLMESITALASAVGPAVVGELFPIE